MESWFELTGKGVAPLQELLQKYGEDGLAEFNHQFAPFFEQEVQAGIKHYDREFQALLPRVRGAPYTSSELERMRSMGQDTSGLVTTDDYRATEGVRDYFTDLLERYRRGEPIQAIIPTGEPEVERSRVMPRDVYRIPTGERVILQKPGVEPRPASRPRPFG